MNTTIMTMRVRDVQTGWDVVTIGRIERAAHSSTMILKGLDGEVIWQSTNIDALSAAGRLYANEQGYTYVDYTAYAAHA